MMCKLVRECPEITTGSMTHITLYFIYLIASSCFEHTNPIEIDIDPSFRHCGQWRHISTCCCDATWTCCAATNHKKPYGSISSSNSHYLNKPWPWSMAKYGITRPQGKVGIYCVYFFWYMINESTILRSSVQHGRWTVSGIYPCMRSALSCLSPVQNWDWLLNGWIVATVIFGAPLQKGFCVINKHDTKRLSIHHPSSTYTCRLPF